MIKSDKNRFREPDISHYTSPEIEVLEIKVDKGFATSSQDGAAEDLGDPLNGSWDW